jgi:DNA modification methylase
LGINILTGDCRDVLRTLADGSVNCIVTSPPYFGLRDYGVDGQMGLEPTPDEFVLALVGVLREARRVLRDDGTLWLNLGDSYAGGGGGNYSTGTRNNSGQNITNVRNRSTWLADTGLKPKDLIGIPWVVALALRADGWYLRQDIIWHKPNPMPESVTDRCTKAHEYLFLLSKSPTYYFDGEAIAEPLGLVSFAERERAKVEAGDLVGTRNKRSVWTVATQPFKEAHFATFPPDLIEPCILAGCPKGGTVLDPFGGAGTSALVADRLGRNATLIELNPEYVQIARDRINADAGMFAEVV